jgi:hypothetical protein
MLKVLMTTDTSEDGEQGDEASDVKEERRQKGEGGWSRAGGAGCRVEEGRGSVMPSLGCKRNYYSFHIKNAVRIQKLFRGAAVRCAIIDIRQRSAAGALLLLYYCVTTVVKNFGEQLCCVLWLALYSAMLQVLILLAFASVKQVKSFPGNSALWMAP